MTNAPGTFGALVICLPSEHTGGVFHVAHGEQRREFDTAAGSAFKITYLAW